MASGGSTISYGGGLVDRYATALYSLADDEHALDRTTDQMQALGRLIDESAPFRRLLESPLIDTAQAGCGQPCGAGGPGFFGHYREVCGSHRGQSPAEPVAGDRFGGFRRWRRSAVASLPPVWRPRMLCPLCSARRLRARLIEAGYGQVNIEEQVDATLLGGLTVRIGARLFDSSIKSRLQRLQYAMKGAA